MREQLQINRYALDSSMGEGMHVLLERWRWKKQGTASSDVMLVMAIKPIQEVGPKLATSTPAFST